MCVLVCYINFKIGIHYESNLRSSSIEQVDFRQVWPLLVGFNDFLKINFVPMVSYIHADSNADAFIFPNHPQYTTFLLETHLSRKKKALRYKTITQKSFKSTVC